MDNEIVLASYIGIEYILCNDIIFKKNNTKYINNSLYLNNEYIPKKEYRENMYMNTYIFEILYETKDQFLVYRKGTYLDLINKNRITAEFKRSHTNSNINYLKNEINS